MSQDEYLECLLAKWHLGDKLQRLARWAPQDVRAIEHITNDALRARWPSVVKFQANLPRCDKS